MKQQIENIINKNLPEKMEWQGGEAELHIQIADGFNQALSQIDTSLIADEVLKVMVEKIKEEKEIAVKQLAYEKDAEVVEYLKGKENLSNDLLNLLTNSSTLEDERSDYLSPNKENKNNERI